MALLLLSVPALQVAGGDCTAELSLVTVKNVIESLVLLPEEQTEQISNIVIYKNCLGYSRSPGKYSTMTVTVEFLLRGVNSYTQQDFECYAGSWFVSQTASNTSHIASSSQTPCTTCNQSLSRKCAECSSSKTDNTYHCVECPTDCSNSSSSTAHPCYGPSPGDCCNYHFLSLCYPACPVNTYSADGVNCICENMWTGEDCMNCPIECHNGTHNAVCDACDCYIGYEGVSCQLETDYCETTPCQNGANCTYDRYGYTCTCSQGYTNENCSEQIDYCTYPIPCYNNAHCVNSLYGYSCECQPGNYGYNCEFTDTCYDNPCQYGGRCENFTNGYTCHCTAGYIGENCEITDYCGQNSGECMNGASCVNLKNKFECNCTDGFHGQRCESENTICKPNNPCMNFGLCTLDPDNSSSYTCKCLPSYTGHNCETEIDQCENITCLNNGTCSTDVYSFVCACVPGLTGRYCEDIDYCTPYPCLNNASCSYNSSGFNCTCNGDYYGELCEHSMNYCKPNPCKSNSTCINSPTGYSCVCQLGYTGTVCEEEIDYCSLNTSACIYGECINTNGSFYCKCDPGYIGDNCSDVIDSCVDGVCLDRGVCITVMQNYTCECWPPYRGRNCELIDPTKLCKNITCNNGGTCNQTALNEASQSELTKILSKQQYSSSNELNTFNSPIYDNNNNNNNNNNDDDDDTGVVSTLSTDASSSSSHTDISTGACSCSGHWTGDSCDVCSLSCADPARVDCDDCNCAGKWEGPDCSECSGDVSESGDCLATEPTTPNDTSNTNIIPIIIPIMLGLGGLGSLPFLGCCIYKCRCKKCRRTKHPKVNVHIVKDGTVIATNGVHKNIKKEKVKIKGEEIITPLVQQLNSPSRSIMSDSALYDHIYLSDKSIVGMCSEEEHLYDRLGSVSRPRFSSYSSTGTGMLKLHPFMDKSGSPTVLTPSSATSRVFSEYMEASNQLVSPSATGENSATDESTV